MKLSAPVKILLMKEDMMSVRQRGLKDEKTELLVDVDYWRGLEVVYIALSRS